MPLDLEAVQCVEQAFASLSDGNVVMPPILSMPVHDHNGEIDVKTAYIRGLEQFAVKMSPGFFDNPKLGLASTNGLMVVFSSSTGLLEALLLDNGWLTDVRTAAAGAVAARFLSNPDSAVATIIGTGLQARMQLQAMLLVRDIREVYFWGRSADKAAKVAAEMSKSTGIPCHGVADAKTAVGKSDIVVTTTPATQPVFAASWLHPGLHVTAMGSDQETKNELEASCIPASDLYVPDRLSQCRAMGELRSAIVQETIAPDAEFSELGSIITGKAAGRETTSSITIADLTGTGVQDTAIATLAVARARSAAIGTKLES